MKLKFALPTLESILRNTSEDPMVRHEVRPYKKFHSLNIRTIFFSFTGSRGNGRDIRPIFTCDPERIPQ